MFPGECGGSERKEAGTPIAQTWSRSESDGGSVYCMWSGGGGRVRGTRVGEDLIELQIRVSLWVTFP